MCVSMDPTFTCHIFYKHIIFVRGSKLAHVRYFDLYPYLCSRSYSCPYQQSYLYLYAFTFIFMFISIITFIFICILICIKGSLYWSDICIFICIHIPIYVANLYLSQDLTWPMRAARRGYDKMQHTLIMIHIYIYIHIPVYIYICIHAFVRVLMWYSYLQLYLFFSVDSCEFLCSYSYLYLSVGL